MSQTMRRVAVIALLGFVLAPGALAQGVPQPRLLTVGGIGEVKVKPDANVEFQTRCSGPEMA